MVPAVIFEQDYTLSFADLQAAVHVTVDDDAPGYAGKYKWNYEVTNTEFYSYADIGIFAIPVGDPDDVIAQGNNAGWDSHVGTLGEIPNLAVWQIGEFGDLLGQDESADFWIVTEPRAVAILNVGLVSDSGFATQATAPIAAPVAAQGMVSTVLIDFSNLPAAGNTYTLTIKVVATDAGKTRTVSVDNSMGVNTPQDTRDAVKDALTNGDYWEVEAVGTTKLKIKTYYFPGTVGPPRRLPESSSVKDIEVEGKGLKDDQKPKYTFTRVQAANNPADGFAASTGGGTWVLGFATNTDASVLADDVVITVTIHTASGDTPVAITLSADMTPEDIATAVTAELGEAGFAFNVSGSQATLDDPDGDIDSITFEYNTTGSTPTVNWLTETIGFHAF